MAYQQNNQKSKLQRLGGLWIRVGKKTGSKFLTGVVTTPSKEEVELLVFKNDNKNNPKSPDYVVYLGTPKSNQGTGQAKQSRPQTQNNEPEDDDIPF